MLPIFDQLRPGQQVRVEHEKTDDLHVVNSGAEFDCANETLDYLWFELEEREAGQVYHTFKAIKLRVLTYIPIEARDDPDILGKMVTVLRGLYNARVDFIHLHAGIFQEPALGIVQVYGVVGVSQKSLYDALRRAEAGVSALLAAMANYPQSRLSALDTRQAQSQARRSSSQAPHPPAIWGRGDRTRTSAVPPRLPLPEKQLRAPPESKVQRERMRYLVGFAVSSTSSIHLHTVRVSIVRSCVTVLQPITSATASATTARPGGFPPG